MRGESFAYCDLAMNNGSIAAKKYFDSLREDGYRVNLKYPMTLENKLHKLFNLCNPAFPLPKKWKRGQVPTPEGS